TDDALLFADMIRLCRKAFYMGEKVTDADKLAAKLRATDFFMPDGERRTGEGEYIVVLRPQFGEGGRVAREAMYEVNTRQKGQWKLVRKLVKKEPEEVV